MKGFRALTVSALLALGLGMTFASATPVSAGERTTAPGVYDASIVYVPGISVPGGLPDCVDRFAQQSYVGKLTVTQNGTGYKLSFVGENSDDASLSLRASAEFNSNWTGFLLGGLGGRDDAILGIDAANLESARIIGRVLGENGNPGTLIARIGAGGTVESCRFVGRGAQED
jgi:hypothetical protein